MVFYILIFTFGIEEGHYEALIKFNSQYDCVMARQNILESELAPFIFRPIEPCEPLYLPSILSKLGETKT